MTEERIDELLEELIKLSNRLGNDRTISDLLANKLSFRKEHPTIVSNLFHAIIRGFTLAKIEYKTEVPHHTDERLKLMYKKLDKLN